MKRRPHIGFKDHVEALVTLYGSPEKIPDRIKHNVSSFYAQQNGFPDTLAFYEPSQPESAATIAPEPVTEPTQEAPATSEAEAEQPAATEDASAATATETEEAAVDDATAPTETVAQTETTSSTPISPRSLFTIPSQ